MRGVPKLVPVSDLRQDVAAVLKRVQASREPTVITQRGRATAVLLSIEAYERRERERELLQFLARGEKDIAAGRGASLEEVLVDADRVLAAD